MADTLIVLFAKNSMVGGALGNEMVTFAYAVFAGKYEANVVVVVVALVVPLDGRNESVRVKKSSWWRALHGRHG